MYRLVYKVFFFLLLFTLITETVTNFLVKQENMMALVEKQEKEKDGDSEKEKFVDEVFDYVATPLNIIYIIPEKISFQSSRFTSLPEIPPDLS